MNPAPPFPLPAPILDTHVQPGDGRARPFEAVAFRTPNYAPAARLLDSCARVGLPLTLHTIPAIHRSVSARGTDDPATTKPNLIHAALERRRRPILYLDADVVFREAPTLLERIVAGGHDLALYNWAADEHTDAFRPLVLELPDGPSRHRFFRFANAFDHFDPAQLVTSGAVQLWGDSGGARALLAAWQRAILEFPEASDDACLDFAFNNPEPERPPVRPFWLPKAYVRYPWWIYARPVIDHPDWPAHGHHKPIEASGGRRHFHADRARFRTEVRLFPRGAVIDTQERLVLEPGPQGLRPVSPTDQNFWITPPAS